MGSKDNRMVQRVGDVDDVFAEEEKQNIQNRDLANFQPDEIVVDKNVANA